MMDSKPPDNPDSLPLLSHFEVAATASISLGLLMAGGLLSAMRGTPAEAGIGIAFATAAAVGTACAGFALRAHRRLRHNVELNQRKSKVIEAQARELAEVRKQLATKEDVVQGLNQANIRLDKENRDMEESLRLLKRGTQGLRAHDLRRPN